MNSIRILGWIIDIPRKAGIRSFRSADTNLMIMAIQSPSYPFNKRLDKKFDQCDTIVMQRMDKKFLQVLHLIAVDNHVYTVNTLQWSTDSASYPTESIDAKSVRSVLSVAVNHNLESQCAVSIRFGNEPVNEFLHIYEWFKRKPPSLRDLEPATTATTGTD